MSNFYAVYQNISYIVLHYCSSWMILTCILSAGISWHLFTLLSKVDSGEFDSYFAWWTTAIWGGLAIIFALTGFLN